MIRQNVLKKPFEFELVLNSLSFLQDPEFLKMKKKVKIRCERKLTVNVSVRERNGLKGGNKLFHQSFHLLQKHVDIIAGN